MFRKSAIAAALLVCGSTGALALGLGDIAMKSVLNQPLLAEIDLTSATGTELEDIRVSLASLEAHQRAGLNKSASLTGFQFAVEKTPAGNVVVRVTSKDAIREPFIEFLLELEWPKGRLLREYTVLVDPPVTMPATPVVPAAPVTQAAAPPVRSPVVKSVPAQRVTAPTSAPVRVSAAPAVADSYGPVRRSETLWAIAEKMRPDSGVSIYQMMQALLRANPDAFMNNNINNMKSGVTLTMPTRSEMMAMDALQAREESGRQFLEWKAAREQNTTLAQVDSGSDQLISAPDGGPGLAVADQPADASAASETESRLSLVAPEVEGVSGDAVPGEPGTDVPAAAADTDLKQQLALATEEAVASRAESLELQSRVNELEEQIATMKRLLELKDESLAQLQNKIGSEEELSSVTMEAVEETAATAPETETDAAASTTDEELAVSPPPVAADTQGDLVGRLTSNPMLLGGGALLVLLLGGLLWKLSNRRDQGLLEDEETLEKLLAQEIGRQRKEVPVVNIRENESEEEETVENETAEGDALTEADVFLAYGRIQQAEDTLQSALEDHPGDRELLFKLLEVYHAAGNAAAFEQTAMKYHEGMEDGDEHWDRVVAMGSDLVPGNALFGAGEGDATPDIAQGGHPSRDVVANVSESLEFALDAEMAGEGDEEEGVLASDDEVSTKLDLARAYIDMDDQESARSILDEVMEEGNNDQKQEAERIIARLARTG